MHQDSAAFHTVLHDRMDATGSVVCLGIDPRPEAHPSTHPANHDHDPAQVAKSLVIYFRDIVDASMQHLAAIKIQSAFFERLGIPGLIGMAQLIADTKERGIPLILDVKRGDIGSTAEAYADAYLRDGSFGADAITVQPYLGLDSIEPFLQAAGEGERGLFVLVRTSNPGGADVQDVETVVPGVTVADRVADLLTERARDLGIDDRGYGPLGAVVGATIPDRLKAFRERLPHSILLVPGYGAQGAGAEDVRHAFDRSGFGALISASRSLTYLEGVAPANEAAAAAERMKLDIQSVR